MLSAQCTTTTQADVVALDQVYFWNRLGTVEPQGMVFALSRDIVPINAAIGIAPGNVQLRPDKRPRPLILRVNAGGCLQINFRNLLNPAKPDKDAPSTRTASVHATGMQLVGSIASDGSNVGANTTSLVAPGGTATYTFFAEHEGGYPDVQRRGHHRRRGQWRLHLRRAVWRDHGRARGRRVLSQPGYG